MPKALRPVWKMELSSTSVIPQPRETNGSGLRSPKKRCGLGACWHILPGESEVHALLARAASKEFGVRGISMNAIGPGPMETPIPLRPDERTC